MLGVNQVSVMEMTSKFKTQIQGDQLFVLHFEHCSGQ